MPGVRAAGLCALLALSVPAPVRPGGQIKACVRPKCLACSGVPAGLAAALRGGDSSADDSDSFNAMVSVPSSDDAVVDGRVALLAKPAAEQDADALGPGADHCTTPHTPPGAAAYDDPWQPSPPASECDGEADCGCEENPSSSSISNWDDSWWDSDPESAAGSSETWRGPSGREPISSAGEPSRACTRFGWGGRLLASPRAARLRGAADEGVLSFVMPDDTYPMNKGSGQRVTTRAQGKGLSEAIQVLRAGDTLLVRAGYYKWQIGGMPAASVAGAADDSEAPGAAESVCERRELSGDPVLVPLPVTVAGEWAADAPLANVSMYSAAMSPNINVRMHGQWLLTGLPPPAGAWRVGTASDEAEEGAWGPFLRPGRFENLMLVHRTNISPSPLVTVTEGRWVFTRCQLRAAGGGVPIALYGRSKVAVRGCGVGGSGAWGSSAAAGAVLYESAALRACESVFEWVGFSGEGVRVCDRARAQISRTRFQYNGVDLSFTPRTRVELTRCCFRGSDVAALWRITDGQCRRAGGAGASGWGEDMDGRAPGRRGLYVIDCEFAGQVWRAGGGHRAGTLAPRSAGGDAHTGAGAPVRGLVWRNVTVREAETRPRAWRPPCKRAPAFWDSSGEMWSTTESEVAEEWGEGGGQVNDPFPVYDVVEVVNPDGLPQKAQTYAHLEPLMKRRDQLLRKTARGCL